MYGRRRKLFRRADCARFLAVDEPLAGHADDATPQTQPAVSAAMLKKLAELAGPDDRRS